MGVDHYACDDCGRVRYSEDVKYCDVDGVGMYLCENAGCYEKRTRDRVLLPPEGSLQLVVFASNADMPTRAVDLKVADIVAAPVLPRVSRAVLVFRCDWDHEAPRLTLPMTLAETIDFLRSAKSHSWAQVRDGGLMDAYKKLMEGLDHDEPCFETKERILLGADAARRPLDTKDLARQEGQVRAAVSTVLKSSDGNEQVPELVDLVCQWWRPTVEKHLAESHAAAEMAMAKHDALCVRQRETVAFVAKENSAAAANALRSKIERIESESRERSAGAKGKRKAAAPLDSASGSGIGSGPPPPAATKRHKSSKGATTAAATKGKPRGP